VTYRVSIDEALDIGTATALWDRASTAIVFNHPAWWQAVLATFGEGRRSIITTVRRDNEIVAIWPFWEKSLGARESFARVIEPVGARVSDYVMPLVANGHPVAEITGLMLKALEHELDPRTLLLWPKAPMIEDCDAATATAFAGRSALIHRSLRACPYLPLAETYAAQEAAWSKRQRGDVRRQFKRIGQFGDFSLTVYNRRDEIVARLPYLIRIHLASWVARTGISEFENGPMGAFIFRLAETLPERLMHYSEATLVDRPVSAHLGFRYGDRILWYKPAFDIAWQNYSPGKLHIALAARWAIENGYREIDFMQGTEPYKFDWTSATRETRSTAISARLAYPVWAWNTRVRKMAAEYRS
jgi:CelD/BcsL family acetyltransferase involved in cellulose biosynthesis